MGDGRWAMGDGGARLAIAIEVRVSALSVTAGRARTPALALAELGRPAVPCACSSRRLRH
jgi:hypothetical protein